MRLSSSSSGALARAGLASLALAAATSAQATEGGGGVYPYGLNTVASGVLPKPSNYLYMYNSVYGADVTTTDDGAPAPVDFDVDVRAHTLRYLHSFKDLDVLGGGVGVLVAQPFIAGRADVGPAEGDIEAFGDTTVGVMLGWHRPQLHWMTGVDVTLPTGSYSEARLVNAGRNQWAGTFYGSLTAAVGGRFDANLRTNLTVNGTNEATDYHSGLEAGVEWSLNCRLGKGWSVGLNGYSTRQLTDDELDGEPVAGTGRKLRVDAFGPQLIYRGGRWGATGKWQHESGAHNKAEGDKYWLQLFVGL
jgi:hypothetical protein